MTSDTQAQTQTSGSSATSSGGCADTGAVTTVYAVTGMTCGHCEGAVSEEISALPGVSSVKAEAATGKVTVTSAAPLDEEAVRAAVDEAGYELTGRA
ncbi:heavy-metal-associated domain-containing protein [Streptomyces sp. IpFD-1.1]|uniref:heavy-metal-associated domain-containing protein n=1 Tax=Streptomyces sp. IpFD-1.1 TaxID=2841664 RepID=UPI0020952E36|nr:heavy-metal-associated domain-containing protein [Streptomyces sp. IpFD-1.1]MCO6750530.1 heavy-metal-associated domain-containing protein [Streptomyces sp. IpFD-1.1]